MKKVLLATAILIGMTRAQGEADSLIRAAREYDKAGRYEDAVMTYSIAASMLRGAGRADEAVALVPVLKELAGRAENARDYGSAGTACGIGADILLEAGKTDDAATLYKKSGEFYEKAGHYTLASYAYGDAAGILKKASRADEANTLYRKAEEMRNKAGSE